MTAARWHGRAALGAGWLLYVGAVGATALHAHHAVQILRAEPALEMSDRAGRVAAAAAAVVPAGVPHAFVSSSPQVVLLHLDPFLAPAAGLPTAGDATAGWLAGAAPLAATDLADLLAADRPAELVALVLDALAEPGHDSRPPVAAVRHPAVDQALRLLPQLVTQPVRLADVAARIGISPSRLAHVFSEQVGLPFRAYVRWLRFRTAIGQVAAGASLTDAAHAAGFADSAHLTRVTHRTFGLAPSAVAGATIWVDEGVGPAPRG